jgi:biotin carboxylase
MGILDKVGEIAGAVAAVEATEKVDPNAGFLTKAAAAVAGYEGAGKLEELVEKKEDEKKDDDNSAQQADSSDSQT